MQKWAFCTLLLYVVLVVVVFIPAIVCVFDWLGGEESDLSIDLSILKTWQFRVYCGIGFLMQALLLLFPVRVSEGPMVPKRLIWVPVITSALMFSILLLGIIWSVTMAIWGDDLLDDYFLWASLGVVLVSWGVWMRLFYRFSKKVSPKDFSQRTIGWLIKGSILELLVAVPSHIIVRRRDECCAPGISALGISAGLVIMLLAFGPGLYFLFRRRFESMKPKSKRNGA